MLGSPPVRQPTDLLRTVAEELILPSAADMVPTIIDETAASKLKAMPLSKTTKSPLMLPLQWLLLFFFFRGRSYAFDFPKLSQNTNLSYVCCRVTSLMFN